MVESCRHGLVGEGKIIETHTDYGECMRHRNNVVPKLVQVDLVSKRVM